MLPELEKALADAGLSRLVPTVQRSARPTVGYRFVPVEPPLPPGASKFGGAPDVPPGFSWPQGKDRPLDFLLQINLDEANRHLPESPLPRSGSLLFFYDRKEEPWGFDPADRDGSRVVYVPETRDLAPMPHPAPDPDLALEGRQILFYQRMTYPHWGSRDGDRLLAEAGIAEDDEAQIEALFGAIEQAMTASQTSEEDGDHRLLGHALNIQDDMQLEAQLVSHGLYCGDASGYEDPRAAQLEPGADDWMLLLQLDSDDDAGIMWGDCGMLYYWIRRDDLEHRCFDHVWMGLQCF